MNNKLSKALFAIALAMVCTLSASAQVKFGIKAGVNMNKVDMDFSGLTEAVEANEKSATGFFAGLTADVTIPLAGIGADIAVLYDCKKMKIDGGEESDSKTLNYITIPVNVKYTLGFSSLASAYLATGPQFSYNIGGKSWGDLTEGGAWALKSSEFSWNIGAGVTVMSHYRVGYNYNIAMGKTAEMTAVGAATSAVTGELKNNTHQFSFTYLF